MSTSIFRASLASVALIFAAAAPGAALAQKSSKADKKKAKAPAEAPLPMIGDVVMKRTNTIAQNLTAAPTMKTLVELATLADLAGTLAGPGPYTVLAPEDSAFAMLPPATVAALKVPANKAALTRILNYHILPGALDFAAIKAQIVAGGGTAQIATAAGVPLTFQIYPVTGGETLILTSANGNKAYVTAADIRQTNGLFHVINGVLSPDAPPPQPTPAPQPAPTPQPAQ